MSEEDDDDDKNSNKLGGSVGPLKLSGSISDSTLKSVYPELTLAATVTGAAFIADSTSLVHIASASPFAMACGSIALGVGALSTWCYRRLKKSSKTSNGVKDRYDIIKTLLKELHNEEDRLNQLIAKGQNSRTVDDKRAGIENSIRSIHAEIKWKEEGIPYSQLDEAIRRGAAALRMEPL